MKRFDGIEGVTGDREVVGAVLALGVKSASLPAKRPDGSDEPMAGKGQAPVYADRFWIVSRFEDERRIRPLLPEFMRFNTAPAPARQVIHGNLVHATIAQAFHYQLKAQKLPKPEPNPTGNRAACEGDGRNALRFAGVVDGEQRWREIDCPNAQCPFRQGNPAPCKPFLRFYFRPSWDHFADKSFLAPTPTMKWASGSWYNVEAFVSFFRHVSDQAEQLGIIPPRAPGLPYNPLCPVFGLPFVMTLGRKTNPEKRTSYPVVTISETMGLIDYFRATQQKLAEIGGRLLLAEPSGATSEEESEPEAIAADWRQISPGVPSAASLPVLPALPPAASIDWSDRDAVHREALRLVDLHAPARQSGVISEAWDVEGRDALERLSIDALVAGVKFLRESE